MLMKMSSTRSISLLYFHIGCLQLPQSLSLDSMVQRQPLRPLSLPDAPAARYPPLVR